MSDLTEARPILISGAGLCGLLLARSLLTHSIPFLIYERDTSLHQRAQGYRLRLSVQGLRAIESILPSSSWSKFRAGVSTTRGGGLQRVNAITGERETLDANADRSPVKGTGPGGEIYGVSRGFLRESLMEGLDERIEFGKAVIKYEITLGGEGVIAHFADGTQSPEGCLLVGADGVQSYITKQLTSNVVRVYDTLTRMIHGQTTTSAFKALGEGVFTVQDLSRGADKPLDIVCNVRPAEMDDPSVTFGWTMHGAPGVINAPNDRFSVVGKVAADLSKELTKGWKEEFRKIFEEQEEGEAAFWKMTTSRPDGVPEWTNDKRVTIVGDAVHSMTPAGGNGANTALQSAALLGKRLRAASGWKDGLTDEYEKEMRVFASANVKASFEAASAMFGIKEIKDNVTGFASPTAG